MIKNLFFLFFTLCVLSLKAQNISEFNIEFEAVTLSESVGLQSFACGVFNNEVLLIGGRLDGLHRRQPFASFDSIGHNNQLIVVNLETKQVWKSSINHLETNLYMQLKATNHCFTQKEDSLFIIGGYGIDEVKNDHITFPFLTVFSVEQVIKAVKNNTINNALFIQLENSKMAVTGGQLNTLGDTFFLVGGHKFEGQYNPISRPTFTQKYTNAVHQFQWKNKQISNLTTITDSLLLHKRDYNLLKVHTNNDNGFLLANAGVFQYERKLPWLFSTRISEAGNVFKTPNFRQMYNHYHCANVVFYDSISKTSSAFLFGGIAQFYDTLNSVVQDDQIPFISSVSRLLIMPDSAIFEYKLPVKMPALQGTGAQFIHRSDWPMFQGNLLWTNIKEERTHIGYVLGGIQASDHNVFWINDEDQSQAITTVYKVFLSPSSEIQVKNTMANMKMEAVFKPDGRKDRFRVYAKCTDSKVPAGKVYHVSIKSPKGKIILDQEVLLNKEELLLSKKGFNKPGLYEVILSDPMSRVNEWKQYFLVPEE